MINGNFELVAYRFSSKGVQNVISGAVVRYFITTNLIVPLLNFWRAYQIRSVLVYELVDC